MLQSAAGSSYLPDMSYTFLTAAGGITGSLTNTAGSAFSGLLNVKNLAVSGTSGEVTLGIANNIGSLNADQQWACDNLPTLLAMYINAGRQNNDSKRYISEGTGYLAESSYKSNTIELGGRYTYDVDYGKAQAWHHKPYGEVQVVRYSQDGYNETGADVWNL